MTSVLKGSSKARLPETKRDGFDGGIKGKCSASGNITIKRQSSTEATFDAAQYTLGVNLRRVDSMQAATGGLVELPTPDSRSSSRTESRANSRLGAVSANDMYPSTLTGPHANAATDSLPARQVYVHAHAPGVTALCMFARIPTSAVLLVGTDDGSLFLYDPHLYVLLYAFLDEVPGPILAFATDPASRVLVVAQTGGPVLRFYDSSALQRGHPHALSLIGCILPFRSSIGANAREENTTSALVACKDVPLFCVGSTLGEIALVSHTGHLVARLDANLTSAIIPGPPPLAWPTWLAQAWSQTHTSHTTFSTASASATATASAAVTNDYRSSDFFESGPEGERDDGVEENVSDLTDPMAAFCLTGTSTPALTSPSRRRRLVPTTISTTATTENAILSSECAVQVTSHVEATLSDTTVEDSSSGSAGGDLHGGGAAAALVAASSPSEGPASARADISPLLGLPPPKSHEACTILYYSFANLLPQSPAAAAAVAAKGMGATGGNVGLARDKPYAAQVPPELPTTLTGLQNVGFQPYDRDKARAREMKLESQAQMTRERKHKKLTLFNKLSQKAHELEALFPVRPNTTASLTSPMGSTPTSPTYALSSSSTAWSVALSTSSNPVSPSGGTFFPNYNHILNARVSLPQTECCVKSRACSYQISTTFFVSC